MSKYQQVKRIVREYFEALESATPESVASVLKDYVSEDYNWFGVYPFREQKGADAVARYFGFR